MLEVKLSHSQKSSFVWKLIVYGSILSIALTLKFGIEYLGIVCTAVVGIFTIVWHNVVSRRTTTIGLLTTQITDKDLSDTLRKFYSIIDEGEKLVIYAIDWNEENGSNSIPKPEKSDDELKNGERTILKVLNYYEFVSGGIREGAFDYKIFHRLYRSNIIKIWTACKPFVSELRRQAAEENNISQDKICYFQEIETLAKEFVEHKLKCKI